MQAVPLLVSVVSLLLFFMFLFGIAGIMLFSGAGHYECISLIDGSTEPTPSNNPDEWGCGGARRCPANYTCQVSSAGCTPSCPRTMPDCSPAAPLSGPTGSHSSMHHVPSCCWVVLAPHGSPALPGGHANTEGYLSAMTLLL